MKTKRHSLFIALALLSTLNFQLSTAFAQGTAFTYQGRLQNNGSPASGTYNLTFSLFNTSSGGVANAGPVTNNAVKVTNGLFTVLIDFGSGVFTGQTNWLQIGVETNGVSSFTTLTPRQELTPTPYAIYAEGGNAAGLSGTIQAANVGGSYGNAVTFNNAGNSFTGNGAGLTGVNAAQLNGLTAANFWQLTGNAGTVAGPDFIGTTDNQPLELHVNGQRALRLEPNSGAGPNVIGGASNNSVTPGTVRATIAGGELNTVSGPGTTVGGGYANNGGGIFAVIGGGYGNQVNGPEATVAGGASNSAGPQGSTVAGGFYNQASGPGSFVGGGGFDGASFSGNTASGPVSTVGGGFGNSATNTYATVGGGYQNTAGGAEATVGGGEQNTASGPGAFVGGGIYNNVGGVFAVVGGGYRNYANGPEATVAGGTDNTAGPEDATVAGGFGNQATGYGSFVGGGGFDGSSFSGNTASGGASTVAGGFGNSATNTYATVGGGYQNTAGGIGAFVGGGGYDGINYSPGNSASGGGAVVAGGLYNQASGYESAVGGGYENTASGLDATVAGGGLNVASGRYSFAAGYRAQAESIGSFVWADATALDYNPLVYPQPGGIANSFNVRAVGGVYFATAVNATTGQPTSGMYLSAGGSGWNAYCDRNAKTNFAAVDARDILKRLAAIPILNWNYKTQDPSVRHLGPMAQDFNAAFGVGESDKTGEKKYINSIDIAGVALAAIQGLNQELNEKDAEVEALKEKAAKVDSLEKRLAELEATVQSLAEKK